MATKERKEHKSHRPAATGASTAGGTDFTEGGKTEDWTEANEGFDK
jgi:hypothetical protein